MKKVILKTTKYLCLYLLGTVSLFSNGQTDSFPYNELQIANYEAELSYKNGSFIENRGQLGVFGQPDVSAKKVLFYSAQPDFFDFAGNTGTVNLPTTPPDERLFTEPYEALTGTMYNDYFRKLGPSNQSGTFVAAWGSYITLDGLYDTPDPMSTDNMENELNFKLYPNPSENKVNIVSRELIRELVVFSMDGKMISSQKVNSKTTTLDISSFPKGNYVVKLATKNSIGHSKIVKL